MEIVYRLYGIIHLLAKKTIGRSKLQAGKIKLLHSYHRSESLEDSKLLWREFICRSKIDISTTESSTHYAGYIAEIAEWCLPSWIWTNAAIVRFWCETGELEKAKMLSNVLMSYQQNCGGWIVRDDYDTKGVKPILAPNDSAYIANNAFLTLYEKTKNHQYLDVAIRCADWIIETARPDGIVYTGYNMRDEKWDKGSVIVDTGFTAGLFSRLVEITGDSKYLDYLNKFVKRYIELFYIPNRNGFCTSIDENNRQQGGMFARGQAWALEGLIPAYKVLKSNQIKTVIDNTIDTLLKQQCKNGGWPYNLTRKLMGEDCKAVSVIAKDIMDWYLLSKDERIYASAQKALLWCSNHTEKEGTAKGGIFSYCTEGGVVKNLYTSCAFVYASAYALELEMKLNSCE